VTRLPRLTGAELIAILAGFGFEVVRVKGSHHFPRHPDGRATEVPAHAGEVIGSGITLKILRDCDLTADAIRRAT
jgi:predicted RNA binding protein YcfA (HicA-like mRNA interferase family)